MPNIAPIYLDTNFCRDPQVLRRCLGPNAGLLLDLLVFAAAKTHVPEGYRRPELLPGQGEGRWVRFHCSDFYREFGYNRQTLLAKPGARLVAHVFAGGRQHYQAEYGRSVLDATLWGMSMNAVAFDKTRYQQFGPDRKLVQQLTTVQIFRDLKITRATRLGLPVIGEEVEGPEAQDEEFELSGEPEVVGSASKCIYVSYQLLVGGIFIRNNHYRPQPLVLADYLSLRTAGVTAATSTGVRGLPRQGRSCVNSRLLYCRLLWRWGVWQGERTKHLSRQEEQFSDLCLLLDWKPTPTAAVRLNHLLARVCALDSIPFVASVQQVTQRPVLHRNLTGALPLPYVVVLVKKSAVVAGVSTSTTQLGLNL